MNRLLSITLTILALICGFELGTLDINQNVYAKQLRLKGCIDEDAELYEKYLKLYEESLYLKETIRELEVKS